MTQIDNLVLELDNDIDGDGNTENGVFEIEKNLEVSQEIRTSFLLNNSLDRILGGLNEVIANDDANKRSGITVDVGGGTFSYQVTFTEPDGGTNQWGDGSGFTAQDATGLSARTKADVLMQYLRTGTFGSDDPARLRFGEYNQNGVYDNFVPVAIQDAEVTVNAEQGDSKIEGRLTLIEVGTFDPLENDNRRGF